MKLKMISFFFPVILAGNAMAQDITKTIEGSQLETLTISGPVSVELIGSANTSVHVSGKSDFVNGIDIDWSNKNLYITSFVNRVGENAIVKVYVNNLKSLLLEEGAKLITTSPLHSANLTLTVNDDSQARILTYGKVRVYGNGITNVKSAPVASISKK